ncbi:hypothetical protein Tco_0967757 [Tanacetum coccineum]
MSNHATNWDKANNENRIVNESLTAELERYKERVKILEQRFNVDLSSREKFIDSQMDDMIQMRNNKFAAFKKEIYTLKQTLSKHVKEKESLLTTLNDFGKCFVPQQELSTEQMFWLQSSDKNSEEPSTSNTPIKIEVSSELSKLKEFFNEFDKGLLDEITEVQTVFNQIEAAVEQCSVDRKCSQLQAKDTVISKLKETIHSLRENVNPAKVKHDIDEIETINIKLEHSVTKLLSENEKLHKEKEHLKKTYKELYDSIKPTRVHAKEQCDALIANLNSKSMENVDLKAQIQEKFFASAALKNELKKLKGKNDIDTVVSKPHDTTIAPGMYKLDLEPLAPKVLKNKDAHLDYIKHSREHADVLWEIVENAKELSPLDSNLDSACKYVQKIQEVLVYVRDTCPCLTRPSEKLIAVTPKNKDKKVRFANPVTSSSSTRKQVDSHKSKDSNKPLLHSTRVISSIGASRSKPTANSKSVCAICNECLFDANHDKCVLDYVHDVNVLSKSKPAKRKNKKQIWKPTGKVYTEIGYKWKPTGRTLTKVGNKCPLTRFTSTKVVPLKETTTKSVVTPTQGIIVYSRRP